MFSDGGFGGGGCDDGFGEGFVGGGAGFGEGFVGGGAGGGFKGDDGFFGGGFKGDSVGEIEGEEVDVGLDITGPTARAACQGLQTPLRSLDGATFEHVAIR